MAIEKDITAMTDAQIGTELMNLKNSIKGKEKKIQVLVDEMVKRGYAGKDIPTIGGEYVVNLTSGEERKFNEEKATDVLGAEVVASIYELKRRKVKLALSDFGTLDTATKDLISDLVEATVKATVKKRK